MSYRAELRETIQERISDIEWDYAHGVISHTTYIQRIEVQTQLLENLKYTA